VPGYRPMTLADLAGHLNRTTDNKVRWKLVWEFLEEYRWEPAHAQPPLLQDEPSPVGDDRWDALWQRWPSTWPPSTTSLPQAGPSPEC
jgi:hypothetical protein